MNTIKLRVTKVLLRVNHVKMPCLSKNRQNLESLVTQRTLSVIIVRGRGIMHGTVLRKGMMRRRKNSEII